MAKNSRGLTLIELVVVVAIIGILASLGISGYQASLKRARDGKRKADLQQVRSALEIYRSDLGVYPATGGSYQIQACGVTCGASTCTWGSVWSCGGSTYMETLPSDPQSLNYRYSSNGTTYTMEACLENGNDPQGVSPTLGWGAICVSNKVYQVKNP